MGELAGIGDFLFRIGAFVVVIGIIVFVHEFGHFLAARLVGIRVIRFSIGFPPKLLAWTRGDTEYQIGMIPMGGYVKMAGIIDESFGDEESTITGAKDEFVSKNPFQKSFVLSAGVIMNLLFAWLLAMVLIFTQGKPVAYDPIIGSVEQKMPAYTDLHLKVGDKIYSVNGTLTPDWDTLTKLIHESVNQPVTIQWIRGSDTLHGATTTQVREIPDINGNIIKVGLIGITPKVTYLPIGISEAASNGTHFAWAILRGSTLGFVQLFTGHASVRELVGPIGIVQMSGESAKSGAPAFWGFLILISISVAMINILPLPVLDGGHLLMVWIETAIGKPIPTSVKLRIQQVGIAFLLLMVLFVSYHDIIRMWSSN